MSSALYEPLIERDLDAFRPAAHAFAEAHSVEALWLAVTRFAVLAYAPSQHSKRAVVACLAAHDALPVETAVEMVIECARYAADSRQPWSEPPILDPPEPSSGDVAELFAGDRLLAERWLSARLADAETALWDVVHCDARLMLDTAIGLLPLLGEKGRYALLRMPVWELVADPNARDENVPVQTLITRAVDANGSPDAVSPVFHALTVPSPAERGESQGNWQLETGHWQPSPYRLARDYAQTLIAHHYSPRLPPAQAQQLLHAVHHNLEHGESFADWSFA